MMWCSCDVVMWVSAVVMWDDGGFSGDVGV